MSIEFALRGFQEISDQIGGAPALMICAFFGGMGRPLYVPAQAIPGHTLEKLIGREAFGWLIAWRGGETLHVPSLKALESVRRAGQIAALSKLGASRPAMAALCGVTERRVDQLLDQLRLEGFDLADDLTDDTEHDEEEANGIPA